MLKKQVSLVLTLALTSSLLAGCGSRAGFYETMPNNQISAMSTGTEEELVNPEFYDELLEEEIIIDNELSPEIRDFTVAEIQNLTETNEFPFLLDENTAFTTMGLKSILTLEGIRNKIRNWFQKRAIKKVEKFEVFAQQNPGLANELPVVSSLKGSAKRAKVKELKVKYPTSFNKLTKKIAVSRWMKFEKKNPVLASDLMELSTLTGIQRVSRLEQLKMKHPSFFKVKVQKA